MASLYEIDERLRILEELQIDPDTGEMLSEEDFYKLLDEVQMALNDKIENTICFIKNLESDVDAFKAEEEKLKTRRKVKENLIERLKNRINNYITNQYTDEDGNVDYNGLNKFKMETPKMKLSYRKSDKIETIDIDKIPSQYLKTETKITPIANDIKKALKNGEVIEGAKLVTNYNMQIK